MSERLLRRPIAVFLTVLALAGAGLASWMRAPTELYPDTRFPRLTVTAAWPGASPEVTEAFLTAPLEGVIRQVRGVSRVTSVSHELGGSGVATLDVELARSTPVDFARLELTERIAAIVPDLPEGAGHPVVQPYVPQALQEQDLPFMRYTLTGPLTVEALHEAMEGAVLPALRGTPGIGTVAVAGRSARTLEVELDEGRALALGVSPERVRAVIRSAGRTVAVGAVRSSGMRHTVVVSGAAESAPSVAELAVPGRPGRGAVKIRDVATVRVIAEPPRQYHRVNGEPAVSVDLHRAPGTNAGKVARAVRERIAPIRPRLPGGTALFVEHDESALIGEHLATVSRRALASALAVFALLTLAGGSARAAAAVVGTVGATLSVAGGLMYFAGFSINLYTLMGLVMSLGMLISNSVLVLDDALRRAEPDGGGLAVPILGSSLAAGIVFIPFAYLQDELRLLYVPLVSVVAFSLLASVGLTLFLLPVAARFLPKRPHARRGARAGRRVHAAVLRLALGWPRGTVLLSFALLAAAAAASLKHTEWSPQGRVSPYTPYVDVVVEGFRTDGPERADGVLKQFEQRVRDMPGVESFVSTAGAGGGRLRIRFADSVRATAAPLRAKDELAAFARQFGGIDVRVFGLGPSFYGGAGSPPTYAIQLRGYDYLTVRDLAEGLGRRLRSFPRVGEVDVNATGGWLETERATEMVLALDRRQLAVRSLTALDAVQRIEAAIGTMDRRVPVRLEGGEAGLAVRFTRRGDLAAEELLDTRVPTPAGTSVRLGDLGTLAERSVQTRIVREDKQYRRTVVYEFRGPNRLADRVHQAVMRTTRLPSGYTIDSGDDIGWTKRQKRQVYGALLLALALIFMLSATLFESLRQPLCILLTIPLALIGVCAAFLATGLPFTRESVIGTVLMSGIVAGSGIMVVARINSLRRGRGMKLTRAVLTGTLQRARPLLLSAAAASAGMAPFIGIRQPDGDLWSATIVAILGGVASSTLLVLVVLPAVYYLLERSAPPHPETGSPRAIHPSRVMPAVPAAPSRRT